MAENLVVESNYLTIVVGIRRKFEIIERNLTDGLKFDEKFECVLGIIMNYLRQF